MTLVWLVVVALALWFGFELGRKWHQGEEETELDAFVEAGRRSGVRLNTITMRR